MGEFFRSHKATLGAKPHQGLRHPQEYGRTVIFINFLYLPLFSVQPCVVVLAASISSIEILETFQSKLLRIMHCGLQQTKSLELAYRSKKAQIRSEKLRCKIQ